MREIHFLNGLPRSGSTLLCNILAQNPDIHSTPTSACHDSLFVMRNQWHEWIEHKAAKSLSDNKNLQRVLNAILYSYHDTDRPVVIDKGRGWTSLIEATEFAMGKEMKILVPVRSINQILASLEKKHRKRVETQSEIGDYIEAQTVAGRVDNNLAANGLVGLAYNRIKDALQRGHGSKMYFVEFDDLTHDPEKTMQGIYKFLGRKNFAHDFNNVEQYTHEDDSVYGLDLHTIRQEVKPVKDDSVEILGKEICDKYAGTEFWRR